MIEYRRPAEAGYRPGVCNIGPAEIRRRRALGTLGIAAAVGLGGALLVTNAPAWTRLAIAVPAAGGIDGLLQAQLKFCAGFGMAGLQNMGEPGEAQRVVDADDRAEDRRMALRIHGVSVMAGLAVAAVFTLLAD